MSKIVFYEIKDWEKEYIQSKINDSELIFISEPLNNDNLEPAKTADMISVFIYSKISKELLDQMPNLKVLNTRSTGFDHIDIEECKSRNIPVCNVPFYGENTVAEHTFALILSLSRNIHKSYVRTLNEDFSIDGLTGFDLKGKTLGIIGGGHIGMHVAKFAKGFGMNVLVFDLFKQSFLSEVIGFEYAELNDILKTADIVSLHVPYNPHTHHLINAEKISTMKDGAIIINTARGQLIDTDALYDALQLGKIGGAGLDVLEGEEFIKEEKELLHGDSNNEKWKTIVRNQAICKMDNVVFTPHNAFNSKEALQRILDTSIENLKTCKDGKCQFIVNSEKKN
ncbi:hydroxyacid dehydrogenase [Candidatus Woesearchaeota archaeon]|nr:hydroxyacid dehydrogenase [Candidatus Woesearchaeota archaeon]